MHTKNIVVDNNTPEDSLKVIYEKRVRVENIGPDNIVYNEIFLIVSYQYLKKDYYVSGTARPACMWPQEYGFDVVSI